MIKSPDNIHDTDSISRAATKRSPSISKNRDQHMFFDVKRTRVQRKLLVYHGDLKLGGWQHSRHKLSHRERRHLYGYHGNLEWLRPVTEKRVEERKENTREESDEPHSECPNGECRVVVIGNCKTYFFDGGNIVVIDRRNEVDVADAGRIYFERRHRECGEAFFIFIF